jgi:hypothetical protein
VHFGACLNSGVSSMMSVVSAGISVPIRPFNVNWRSMHQIPWSGAGPCPRPYHERVEPSLGLRKRASGFPFGLQPTGSYVG